MNTQTNLLAHLERSIVHVEHIGCLDHLLVGHQDTYNRENTLQTDKGGRVQGMLGGRQHHTWNTLPPPLHRVALTY